MLWGQRMYPAVEFYVRRTTSRPLMSANCRTCLNHFMSWNGRVSSLTWTRWFLIVPLPVSDCQWYPGCPARVCSSSLTAPHFCKLLQAFCTCRIQRFMLRGLHRDGAPVKEKLKPTSESSPWVKTNTAKIASGTFDTFDTFVMFLLLFGTAHTQLSQWMCVQCSSRNLWRDLRQESIQSWTRSRIYLWARMTWMEHNLRQAWVVMEHSHFFMQNVALDPYLKAFYI